jgi:hypothetical protein
MSPAAKALLIAILSASLAPAQDLTGYWNGISQRTRLVVNLTKDRRGELYGTLYEGNPQGGTIPLLSISAVGKKVTFSIAGPAGPVSFSGTLSDDGNSIQGWFRGQPLKHLRTYRNDGGNHAGLPGWRLLRRCAYARSDRLADLLRTQAGNG